MLKEFKLEREERVISLDLNEITLVEHSTINRNENKEYEVYIMTKAGFNRPIFTTPIYKESINIYNEILEAYKESRNQLDTEKRLKAYIEDVDNKIAIEVKKYLDKITGKSI